MQMCECGSRLFSTPSLLEFSNCSWQVNRRFDFCENLCHSCSVWFKLNTIWFHHCNATTTCLLNFPPNLFPAKSTSKWRRFTGLLCSKKSIGQVQASGQNRICTSCGFLTDYDFRLQSQYYYIINSSSAHTAVANPSLGSLTMPNPSIVVQCISQQ